MMALVQILMPATEAGKEIEIRADPPMAASELESASTADYLR